MPTDDTGADHDHRSSQMSILTPEQKARQEIDDLLTAAGWAVQPRDRVNLSAARGVAVAEFPLETGFADYLLFVDKRPIGVIEAKAAGTTRWSCRGASRCAPTMCGDDRRR